MSISEDSQTLNITNPVVTGLVFTRVFSWLMVSLTLLFLFNNYFIFWRGGLAFGIFLHTMNGLVYLR
ncbi:MAG: hypothetical protein CM1200mP30_06060 [Pseudomonadota bacterium]|nr:MAG: hypothetical protein CM1200mP30_06060 [Pseudomonadota bacterium]